MSMKIQIKWLLIAGLCLFMAMSGACRTADKTTTPMPTLTPPPPAPEEVTQQDNPGSLFQESEAEYLFSDNRARRLGDIVLVNIVENSKATNKADTNAGRDSSMDLGVTTWFDNAAFGVGPFRRGLSDAEAGGTATPFVKVGAKSDFKGSGETSRESSVSATIGCRVVKVLPGGLMQVEGAREIRVNEETQIVVVRGLVRPRDIQSDNSVYSTSMADARIEYYGKGILADKQKPGWLARILDNIWPF